MVHRRPANLTDPARVSVLIPCYNYGHYLAEAVESALTQVDVIVDVLIIDDASTDDSANVALELANRLEHVRVQLHAYNMGHIATYNEGLKQLKGDYVVLLSADDLLAPGSLRRAAAAFEAYPTVGMVYGFASPFLDIVPRRLEIMQRWTIWSGSDWLALFCRRGKNPVVTPSVIMRRDAMAAMGGYDARLRHAADMLLWLQVSRSWDIAYIEGVDQAFYRVHGRNMHATEFAGWITDLRARLETFELFFQESDPDVPCGQELLSNARAAIAEDAMRIARARLLDHRSTLDEITELLDFAVCVVPDLSATKKMRHLRRMEVARPENINPTTRVHPYRMYLASARLRQSFHDRTHWRYWRRFGVYL